MAGRQAGIHSRPIQREYIEEGFDLLGELRQYRLQIQGQQTEHFQRIGADLLQGLALSVVLGHDPRRLFRHEAVGDVGQTHDLTQGTTEIALLVTFGNGRSL